jgi:hypothetical protein
VTIRTHKAFLSRVIHECEALSGTLKGKYILQDHKKFAPKDGEGEIDVRNVVHYVRRSFTEQVTSVDRIATQAIGGYQWLGQGPHGMHTETSGRMSNSKTGRSTYLLAEQR